MSTRNPGTLKVEQVLGKAIDAAKTELKPDLSLAVSGTTYTVPDLIAKLGSYQTVFGGVRDERSALHALLVQRNQLRPELIAFLASLKGVLIGLFGADSPELEKFGFKPRKKAAPLTAEQLLAKATKAKATRAKRGTLGRKQKASVKATGTPVISAVMPAETAPSAASGSSDSSGSAPAGAASDGSSSPSPSKGAPAPGDVSSAPSGPAAAGH